VRALEDPTLVEYLVEHQIGLELCPTSNYRLGVFPSVAACPVVALNAAGALVTINTDTPAVFDISLTSELALLDSVFGLDRDTVDQIRRNAITASFLPADERARLFS